MAIEGTWYNELGSQMNLTVTDNEIKGTYQTAVGDAEGIYHLLGQLNTAPLSYSQAASWTVIWKNDYANAQSTTAWSGQYQLNEDTGEEEIATFWLLVTETESEEDWSATQVGQDIFTRQKPTPHVIKRTHRRAGCSSPKKRPT